MTPDLSKSQGPGRVALAIFSFLAVLPLLLRAIFMAGARGFGRFVMPLESLLIFTGIVFYLVWIYRVTAAVKGSKYSPGWSVGGWLIPVYNFVFPFLSLRDVWRNVMGAENSWVPGVWWGSYVALTALNAVYPVPQIGAHLPWFTGYILMALKVVAFGTWAFAIQQISTKQGPSAVPVDPHAVDV
jgi:hypothetical protein